ncbi:uncharacterized protein L969DRAFT_49290 [Mixia osmundae IAM 14324]|uniref:Conidiation protein 6 n=1 Tax=Mixia osmundae (strain CBS 9802 / IAM 14324 / JCM 22182 / KY 12970) TaxID=764103 RepID=G7E895_MIXOS|nr:uncharacterized protein L969DRAFT_49290 [Mixia osmundae IAM 14324]KEI39159.1 hypothetical protein L969DRAFT_49290 [Mixia osmundae IAM 14324]GAA99055.1 hypothetical protein E5Q_05744 [Mixia osmundae IAM 14324]
MTSNQVEGGFKAALSNPNTSDSRKQEIREALDKGETPAPNDGGHENQRLGGLKAAINNPNVGDDKKAELKQTLESERSS